jgi:hypothetical protein
LLPDAFSATTRVARARLTTAGFARLRSGETPSAAPSWCLTSSRIASSGIFRTSSTIWAENASVVAMIFSLAESHSAEVVLPTMPLPQEGSRELIESRYIYVLGAGIHFKDETNRRPRRPRCSGVIH